MIAELLPAPWCSRRDNEKVPHLAARVCEAEKPSLAVVQKGLRIRMGRYPAEIAEGAEGRGVLEGGEDSIGAVFNNCLGLLNRYN